MLIVHVSRDLHTEKCAEVQHFLVRLLKGHGGDLWVPVYILLTNLPKALCILLAIRLAETLSL